MRAKQILLHPLFRVVRPCPIPHPQRPQVNRVRMRRQSAGWNVGECAAPTVEAKHSFPTPEVAASAALLMDP